MADRPVAWPLAVLALVSVAVGIWLLDGGTPAPLPVENFERHDGELQPESWSGDPEARVPVAEPERRDESAPASDSREEEDESRLRTHYLHGIVLLPDGRPCPHAQVSVHQPWRQAFEWMERTPRNERTQAASVRTDAEGFWRQRVRPGTWYEVEARSEALLSPVARRCQAGERLTLQLGPAGAIHGKVLPVEGESLPGGLMILAYPSGSSSVEERRQAPGLDGRFRFDRLPPGDWRVQVDPSGHVPLWESVELEFGEVAECNLQLERGLAVHGSVRDARTKLPIRGAEISDWSDFQPSVRSDEEGRFRFTGLEEWDEDELLHAWAVGYGRRTVALPQPPGSALQVELIRGRTVTGRILRADGRPAHGAFVMIRGEVHSAVHQFDRHEGLARSDGRFTFRDVRTDMRHGLVAYLAGSGTLIRDLPSWPSEQESVDVGTLRLQLSSTLAGTVVAASGEPLARAEVWVSCMVRDVSALCPGEGGAAGTPDGDLRGVTDDLGRFRFTDLGPGEYSLYAKHPGFVCRHDLEVTLDEGRSSEGLVLTLKPGVPVEGKLLNPEGKPVAGAHIWLMRSTDDGVPMGTASDRDGTFTISSVPPGTYQLKVEPYGFGNHRQPAFGPLLAPLTLPAVEAAVGAKPLEIRLQRLAVIRGRVTDRDAEPAAALVRALGPDGAVLGEARSGADGAFELSLLEGQLVTLVAAFAPDGPQARFDAVPAGAEGILLRIPARP